MPFKIAFASMTSFALFCSSALADDASRAVPPMSLVPTLVEYREAYLSQVLSRLRVSAKDHKTLSAQDIDRVLAGSQASSRASVMSSFFATDLNGDNIVDQEEIADEPLKPVRGGWLVADRSGDGKTSLDEAMAYASDIAASSSRIRSLPELQELLALDPNADGKLTIQELRQIANDVFDRYDLDRDDILSPAEKLAVGNDTKVASESRLLQSRAVACNFPKATADQRVYAIAAYEAGTLSNVAIAGQDRTTEIATVNIGPGNEPIYLIASSYTPMIWKITGHPERIARVHASAGGGVGVIGVPKERVSLRSEGGCVNLSEKYNGKNQVEHFTVLGNAVGKPVDGVALPYTAGYVKIPDDMHPVSKDWTRQNLPPLVFTLDGLLSQDAVEKPSETLKSLKRFSPGGVMAIDPSAVVASGKAESYSVLPEEAGLLQLVQNGTLEESRGGYVVKKSFDAFPAGLNGGHSVTFRFPEGMRRPTNRPGHSTVLTLKGAQQP